jgi:hypothetical protein
MGELQRVSRTSTSSAAPPQPWRRCAPERAAAPHAVRVHTPGGKRPLARPAGGLLGARSRGPGAKKAFEILIRLMVNG